jgi:hypothetical protein
MRRFTVMGFTEAELGFVVAALFAAIAVATLNDRDASAGGVNVVVKERDELKRQLDRTRTELEKVRAELERVRAELEKVLVIEGKRSTKAPQCWEKGEPREPLGEVVVLGENQYLLGAESVAVDGILNHFSASIARAKELDCRFVLIVRPSAGVDAVDHSRAVWPLRGYFDVSDRPR